MYSLALKRESRYRCFRYSRHFVSRHLIFSIQETYIHMHDLMTFKVCKGLLREELQPLHFA